MQRFAKLARPSWAELMDMDKALATAVLEGLPMLEDGRDVDLIARVLGKKDG